MGSRMKNFNMGVLWKIRFLGGGCSRKTNIKGELSKKEGLGHSLDLRWGSVKKKVCCFWGEGWYPNAHYAGKLMF